MEMSDVLDFDDEVIEIQENKVVVEALSEKSVVPKEGQFLGLDISETSTGVCIYENGVKHTSNFSLNLCEDSQHQEVLLRRDLKSKLSKLIWNTHFDLIIIEDVFQGVNPTTTRLLYALNTAIDEMILDGELTCSKFMRVSNQTWKSWLFKIDTMGMTKGLNDKLKIETCLSMLEVTEVGKGYQDRLDATGMLLGYFICKDDVKKKEEKESKKRVVFDDIEFCFESEKEDVLFQMGAADVEEYEEVTVKRWSKSKMLDYLTDNPNYAYMSSDYIVLGKLGDELNLPMIEGGGILGFWVKRKKLKKYIKGDK